MTVAHKIVDEYMRAVYDWIPVETKIVKEPGIEIWLAKIATYESEESKTWRILFTTRNLFSMAWSWVRDQMIPGQDFPDIMDIFEQRVLGCCMAIRSLPKENVLFINDSDFKNDPRTQIELAAKFFDIDVDLDIAYSLFDPKKHNAKYNDPVISRFRKRLEWIQSTANNIIGKELF